MLATILQGRREDYHFISRGKKNRKMNYKRVGSWEKLHSWRASSHTELLLSFTKPRWKLSKREGRRTTQESVLLCTWEPGTGAGCFPAQAPAPQPPLHVPRLPASPPRAAGFGNIRAVVLELNNSAANRNDNNHHLTDNCSCSPGRRWSIMSHYHIFHSPLCLALTGLWS